MVTISCAWFLADFLTGIFHWAEDHLLTRKTSWEWLDAIRRDNDLHHEKPGAMLRYSPWENISMSAAVAWPVATGLFFVGAPVVVWLSVFFASFGNLIHRWSHTHPGALHPFIRGLQSTGVFISQDHHKGHHYRQGGMWRVTKTQANRRFCTMTNWVNPVLDKVRFFDILDFLAGV